MIEKRLKEAEKLGFKRCIIPENNKKYLEEKYKMEIIRCKKYSRSIENIIIR